MGYLMVPEVAKRLRVHRSTVWRWLKNGELKCKRAGIRVLIEPNELERFVNEPRQK